MRWKRKSYTCFPRESNLKEIHNQKPDHPGILVVYQDNDPARDMSYREIIQAIANLESTDVTIAGGFWPLNVYRG